MEETKLVMVELSAKIFPGSKRDKVSEATLASTNQVDEDWFAVQRKRFPDSVMKMVPLMETNPFSTMASSVGRLRNKYLYKLGFQFSKGQYIMKREGWEIMEAAKRSTDGVFESARNELSSWNYEGTLYDRMVEAVRQAALYDATSGRRGFDFDAEDYPSLDEVLDKWCKFKVKVNPFKGAELLPEWITGPMRDEMGEEHKRTFKRNSLELYKEMAGNLKKVADLWSKPDARIIEATIENFQRNLEFVEARNLDGDEGVSALVTEAKAAFAAVDAESLRGSAAFRQEVAASALSVAKKVAEDGRRRFA